jgi:type IV pilus assembly protein PilE
MPPEKNRKSCATSACQPGFSVLELMIVLVVVAILATIAYPSYQESVRKTRRAEGRAALMQVMHQQERHYSQHSTYTTFSASMANGFKWFSGDSPATSSYEISAGPCDGDAIQNCVLLTAEPGTVNVNPHYKDERCRNLTLTSNGISSASGDATYCWQ